jgi:hypothetical protein
MVCDHPKINKDLDINRVEPDGVEDRAHVGVGVWTLWGGGDVITFNEVRRLASGYIDVNSPLRSTIKMGPQLSYKRSEPS